MTDLTINADSPAAKGADALVIDTTTQAFVADVIDESRRQPVLVDFWAPWCGPCRTLSPIIESAVKSAKGAVKLAKMNIDEHPEIPGQLGIQSIPAVIAFVDGKPVDGFVGALPEGRVKEFIAKLVGPGGGDSGVEEVLDEADAALAAGQIQGAAELYAAVRQADSENMRAVAGLARASLAAGDVERARQMLAMVPPAKVTDPVILAAEAEIALAEQTAALGDDEDLRARLLADPLDHAARFDLALISNAQGDRGSAADHLLAIIANDRAWNDEKARKQLLQFFDVWGPKDETTQSARRQLSSLLFS